MAVIALRFDFNCGNLLPLMLASEWLSQRWKVGGKGSIQWEHCLDGQLKSASRVLKSMIQRWLWLYRILKVEPGSDRIDNSQLLQYFIHYGGLRQPCQVRIKTLGLRVNARSEPREGRTLGALWPALMTVFLDGHIGTQHFTLTVFYLVPSRSGEGQRGTTRDPQRLIEDDKYECKISDSSFLRYSSQVSSHLKIPL